MSELKKYLTIVAKNKYGNRDIVFNDIPDEILTDKLFIKYAVKIYGNIIKYASLEQGLDSEIVMEAIEKSSGTILEWLNPKLREDKEIVLAAVKKNTQNIKFASEALLSDKEIILSAEGYGRENISKELLEEVYNNRDLFIEFASSDSIYLKEGPEKFKGDIDLVKDVIKNTSDHMKRVLYIASEDLQKDRDLVLYSIKNKDTSYFYYIKEGFLINDGEIILEGIKSMGAPIFKKSSTKLKNDVDFVLSCFKINIKIFQVLIEEESNILTNHQFILDAISFIDLESSDYDIQIIFKSIISKYNAESQIILELLKKLATKERKPISQSEIFNLINKRLKENEDFFIELVKIDWEYLRYGSSEFKSNSKIISAALKNNGHAIYWASEDSKNDKNLILEAIQNGAGTSIIPYELATKENILLAIRKNLLLVKKYSVDRGDYYKRVSLHMINDVLRDDEEFILEAIKLDGETIEYASSRILENDLIVLEAFKNTKQFMLFHQLFRKFNNDKDLVTELIKVSTSKQFLKYLSIDLRDDKDVVYLAICKSGYELEYASDRLKNDEEIVLKAIEKNSSNIKHMSKDLMNNRDFIFKITEKYPFYSSDIIKLMESFSKELLNDKELILHLLNKTSDIDAIKLCGPKIKNDLDINVAKLNIQYPR
jgi:hypothetical protein